MKGKRVMIFIDGSNFYHSVKDTWTFEDADIDFKRLISDLVRKRHLISVKYYNAALDRGKNLEKYKKQQIFFSELRKIPGFEVHLVKMRKHIEKGKVCYKVKGDDILIATDMLSGAYENSYDVAILVSGDGDFVPVIKKVQMMGKRVENAFFKISSSNYLKMVCNESVPLNEIMEDFLKDKNKPSVA